MKTRHLLIAALLLGGMTAFNACSDKDEVDNIVPPEVEAEGLETVLAMPMALGDKVETRAAAADENDNAANLGKESDTEKIRNYIFAAFECEGTQIDDESRLLDISYEYAGKPLEMEKSENKEWGYSLNPIKFKLKDGAKVAVVVMANCDELFNKDTKKIDLGQVDNYKDFKLACDKKVMYYLLNKQFGGYPMSSNVLVLDNVKGGAFNAVGYGNADKDFVKNIYANYYSINTDDVDPLNLLIPNTGSASQQRILLYRCWSQVELTDIKVLPYAKDEAATFEMTEAFVMNVPFASQMFNATSYTESDWYKWGGDLSYAGVDYTYFCSGWSEDPKEEKTGTAFGEYRSETLANHTRQYSYLARNFGEMKLESSGSKGVSEGIYSKLKSLTISSTESNVLDLSDYKVKGTPYAVDAANNIAPAFNYIVTSSNYGKAADGSLVPENSMLLVVKGRYIRHLSYNPAAAGNTAIDPGVETYYTVVINGEGSGTIVDASGSTAPNRRNEILRNVKYDVSLAIKGPGSKTPLDYDPNTELVSRVRIVPFGHVTQKVEID